MTWREDLQLEGGGSFRGAEFWVSSAERAVGRRTVVHQFPGRNKPVVDDLGEDAASDTLVAYVIGDDYMIARNKLEVAFRKAGPGPLVHPYWGAMTVAVIGKVRFAESPNHGGMAKFTINVIEVDGPEALAPTIVVDAPAAVEAAADVANVELANDFVFAWDTVSGVVEAVRDEAQALVDGVNGITSVMNKMNGFANAAMNQVDAVGDSIQALADGAAALILLPSQLATDILGVVTQINASIATVGDAWDSYFTSTESAGSIAGTPETAPSAATPASGAKRVDIILKAFRDAVAYGSDFDSISETTEQREKQAGNQTAMTAYMRGVSTIESCRSAANIPLESFEQGTAILDELAAQLDTLMDTADDDSYGALVELRTAISNHLTTASADLPRVITFTPKTALPALVLAHNLYGDATRDIDIIDRNNIRNPCITPGEQALEVLSDD